MTFFSKIFTKPDPDSLSTDILGRQRVSLPSGIGNYKSIYGNLGGNLLTSVIGTGTLTYNTDSTITMSVTSGQYYILQSKEYHYYFAGTPQRIDLTVNTFQIQSNLIKRLGYYSSNAVAPYDSALDGIMFVSDGVNNNYYFQIWRAGTKIIDIPITSFDGYARYNLASYDWSKFSLASIDFLWQGGKKIRLGLQLSDGRYVAVHTINYAQNFTQPFCKSPYQPIRYEIRSTTGTGSMNAICAGVARDDGSFQEVRKRSVNTGGTTFSIGTIGTKYILGSLRKLATLRDAYANVSGAGVVITTSDTLLVELIKNPTIATGSLTYSSVPNSCLEFASGNGTQTVTAATGIVLESAYLNNTTPLNFVGNNLLANLYCDIDNNMDNIMLIGTPVTSTMNVAASMTYQELL